MADSTCGPSNAFKGLARHVDQDRSHQQDRVTARPHGRSAQNFRNTPLNSDINGQYGAFHQQFAELPQHPAAHLGPPPLPSHHAMPSSNALQAHSASARLPSLQRPNVSSTAGNTWVGDFQRMNITTAETVPHHSQQVPAPNMNTPWAMRAMPNQYTGVSTFNTIPYRQPGAFQAGGLRNSAFQPEPIGAHGLDNELTDAKLQEELDKEFDIAMNEWMAQNGPTEDEQYAANLVREEADLAREEAERLASALEAAPATTDPNVDNATADTELARAAQELVNSVSDNESDKFRNSRFLDFMRRLAAHELTVRNNEVVQAPGTSNATHAANHADPTTSSSQQQQQRRSGFPGVGERETHA